MHRDGGSHADRDGQISEYRRPDEKQAYCPSEAGRTDVGYTRAGQEPEVNVMP